MLGQYEILTVIQELHKRADFQLLLSGIVKKKSDIINYCKESLPNFSKLMTQHY